MAEWLNNALVKVTTVMSNLLTNIIVAIIIILIGFILGKLLGRLIQKLLHEVELDRILKQAARIKISFEKLISNFIKYFIYFIAIVMALNQMGLTTTILYMISAAVFIVIVLAVFLGIKDFVPNFLAGIYIYRKGFVKEGDRIKVRDIKGKVIHIDLTETRIKTRSGDIIYLPNSILTKEEVVKVKKR